MLPEIIIALIIGILAGTFTGLIPGIHINLVGALLLSISAILLNLISPTILIIFIVAMAITHTFIDFIPSIFLGAPDEDTILAILPGHDLLKKGQGYQAITLATYGSTAAILVILLITPIFIFTLSKIEPTIKFLIPYLLIISTIFLISKEKYKLTAIIVFTLSGFLGIGVFNSSVNQPFLPMLSGLFGASSLIISIKTKVIIPKQKLNQIKIKLKTLAKPVLASAITSPLCCFLPGIGSGQAAVLGTSLITPTKKNFLILLGATNTIVLGLSFIVFYTISKARTGMAATLTEITIKITTNQVLIILATICLTGIICYHWTLFLGKQFSKHINKINYTFLSLTILLIISTLVLIFTGFFGFFIFIISTAIGIFGILSNVKRINLMGCLIVPIVLTYLL
ncbi:MAG: tripartite tricarboxylate transporter permease [Nanoarchaeota archaeon]|nr:tripartite tricarboxylate transporter permease [Nanoarchaeota archaeon]